MMFAKNMVIMSRRSRGILFASVFLFMALGGVVASRFWKYGGIPQEFTSARLQGAIIAQNIVNLSNQSSEDLIKINELDQKGNFTEALNLTTDVIKKSQEIRDQAVALSSQVETMIRALSAIDSLDARQAALESISSRLALISRLINYSGYLGQLLDTLGNRFSGQTTKDRGVSNLVDQINAEVRAINNFNAQAGQAMDRFDGLVKQ
jgi:hypothetical protein